MLLFLESFANWDTLATGALGKWTTISNGASVLSIGATASRTGGPAAVFYAASPVSNYTLQSYLAKTLASGQTTLTLGFALLVSQRSTDELALLSLQNINDRLVSLSILSTGQLRVRAGNASEFATGTLLGTTAGGVIGATNVWYYVEIQVVVSSTVGSVNVQVNGANVLSLTNVNTDPLGDGSILNYQLGVLFDQVLSAVNVGFTICDHYVANASGSQNTGFLGDTRVACVFPTGEGTNDQFSPNGAGSNWQCVDDNPEQDGDTTYVSSSTVSNIDEYTHGATPANTGTIYGVQLCAVARKDTAGTRSHQNFIQSASASAAGAAYPLSLSYAWYLDVVESDPNTSAAWTKAGLDAAQLGVKVAA